MSIETPSSEGMDASYREGKMQIPETEVERLSAEHAELNARYEYLTQQQISLLPMTDSNRSEVLSLRNEIESVIQELWSNENRQAKLRKQGAQSHHS